MTDSGFSGLPPGARPASIPGIESARPQRAEIVRIVDISGMLRDNNRAQRISGEVIQDNKDGTVSIKTASGDMRIQKPPAHVDLLPGTKLEMDVPAGHPPRQVTIREMTPPPAQTDRSLSARGADNARREDMKRVEKSPVITAPPRAPVEIPEQAPLAPPTLKPAPLPPEQIIRLMPLPPDMAAKIIIPPAVEEIVMMFSLPPELAKTGTVPSLPPGILEQLITQALPPGGGEISGMPILPAIISSPLPPAITGLAESFAPLSVSNAVAVATPVASPAQILLTMMSAALPSAAAAVPPMLMQDKPSPALPLVMMTEVNMPLLFPKATQTFMMALPENYIQTPLSPLAAGPMQQIPLMMTQAELMPIPTINAPLLIAHIAPKMDAQILMIGTPQVKLTDSVLAGIIGSPPITTPVTIPEMAAMNPPVMPAMAGALQGEVRGITAQNFPVITVNFPALNIAQDFLLQFPAENISTGAPVTIMPQPGTVPATAAAMALAGFTPLPEFMNLGVWPALDEAFQALQQAIPQHAAHLAQNYFPNPAQPQRIPAIAMMFMAAIKGGDMQSWLGEKTIDTLRRIGKAEILTRLSRDGATLSRLAAQEPASAQEWRTTALPLLWDNHIHKALLHYRHDREAGKDGEPDKHKGTRFILDIAPPRMGDVQLDGLHRPAAENSRLDIILRTRENLSPAMQQSMRRLYIDALEQAGMKGELSFSTKSFIMVGD